MPRYIVELTYRVPVEAENKEWARHDAAEIVRATYDQPDYVEVEEAKKP